MAKTKKVITPKAKGKNVKTTMNPTKPGRATTRPSFNLASACREGLKELGMDAPNRKVIEWVESHRGKVTNIKSAEVAVSNARRALEDGDSPTRRVVKRNKAKFERVTDPEWTAFRAVFDASDDPETAKSILAALRGVDIGRVERIAEKAAELTEKVGDKAVEVLDSMRPQLVV